MCIVWWNYGYWSKANLMLFSKFPIKSFNQFSNIVVDFVGPQLVQKDGRPFQRNWKKVVGEYRNYKLSFFFWASMFSLWNPAIFRTARIGNDQLEKKRRNAISWQSNVTNFHFSYKESLNKWQYITRKSRVFLIYTAFFCVLRALRKLMRRPVLHINLNRKQFSKSSPTESLMPHCPTRSRNLP